MATSPASVRPMDVWTLLRLVLVLAYANDMNGRIRETFFELKRRGLLRDGLL